MCKQEQESTYTCVNQTPHMCKSVSVTCSVEMWFWLLEKPPWNQKSWNSQPGVWEVEKNKDTHDHFCSFFFSMIDLCGLKVSGSLDLCGFKVSGSQNSGALALLVVLLLLKMYDSLWNLKDDMTTRAARGAASSCHIKLMRTSHKPKITYVNMNVHPGQPWPTQEKTDLAILFAPKILRLPGNIPVNHWFWNGKKKQHQNFENKKMKKTKFPKLFVTYVDVFFFQRGFKKS